MEGLRFGTNISHWLSQCRLDRALMEERFGRADVERLASWGMDHFRLPVDYRLFAQDGGAGDFSEEGLSWIDRALDWADHAKLNVVLDMHFLPGHDFGREAANTIWRKDGEDRALALAIWEMLAQRYRGARHLALELLNEPVAADDDDWNGLAADLLAAIRRHDPGVWVVIPSNRFAHLSKFAALKRFDDPRVIYTFHSYEPLLFTHQNAPWVPLAMELGGGKVPYPGPLDKALLASSSLRENFGWMAERVYGADYLEDNLRAALDFRAKCGNAIYCGEFGVITHAGRMDRLRWHRDIVALYRRHDIGMASWDYKSRDFGLVDEAGRVDEDLLEILRTGL